MVCVPGIGKRPGSGSPDITGGLIHSLVSSLHTWESGLLPAFKGELRSWRQPPFGYPGAWHRCWEHTGLETWLLSSQEQCPELRGQLFSVLLYLGWRWRGKKRERRGDPKGFQASGLASRALRPGLPLSLRPEGSFLKE